MLLKPTFVPSYDPKPIITEIPSDYHSRLLFAVIPKRKDLLTLPKGGLGGWGGIAQ